MEGQCIPVANCSSRTLPYEGLVDREIARFDLSGRRQMNDQGRAGNWRVSLVEWSIPDRYGTLPEGFYTVASMSTSGVWKSDFSASLVNLPRFATPSMAGARPIASFGTEFRQGHLLAHLHELVALDRKQIAALPGFAPFNRDNGKLCGRRCIWVDAHTSGASLQNFLSAAPCKR